MKHVAILTHEHDDFDREDYLLGEMAVCWRENGIRVTVVSGPDANVDADIAVLHVDLTVMPKRYLEAARRYPRVINGRVTSIAKRAISSHRLSLGDSYPGPVIVKTNRNTGGMREHEILRRESGLSWYAGALRNRCPWPLRSRIHWRHYPIFDTIGQVPRVAWYNPDLIVERFLPERSGELYCLRTWVFFGDRESNSLSYSTSPIIKSENVIRREQLPEVPVELRRMREQLGFDYGKFDYGIVDGRAVLYDANRTPTLGRLNREAYRPRARELSQGISSFQ